MTVLLVVVFGVILQQGPALAAPPNPPIPLPPEVDLIDGYEGQSLCNPAPKAGTLQLRDTLWQTYGSSIWAGISRDCNASWDPGISEHKDGRAIDWGVSVRNPATKAMGDEFFAWATANNGEMARRMGIMYIIWDSRMWRQYDMGRGFSEFRTCVRELTSASYDTTCHRDHMHISMTWHGAGAQTSWYSGKAVTRKPCTVGAPVTVQPGSPSAPAIVFDPLAGIGVRGGVPCYLNRSIQTLKVNAGAQADSRQRIRVTQLSLNAPTSVRIWTGASSINLPLSTALPAEYELTLAADRLLYVQVPVGQAGIRIETLGSGSRQQYEAFVTQGYRDVLGRDPEPGGLQNWTSAVMSGEVPRTALIETLTYSTEGSRRIASSFYLDILGREPDPGGLVHWGQLISQRAVKVKDVRQLFWLSDERIAKSGTPEQWINDIHLVELDRPADGNEAAKLVAVAKAQGRQAAASAVMGSTEWLNRQVTAQYQTMLRRDPDPSGLASWTGVLAQTDLPALQSALGASEEYFSRAIR